MDDEIWGLVKVIGCVALVFVLMIGLCIGFQCLANYQTCNTQQALNPEMSYKWVFWGGCMVQLPSGMYVPWENRQYIQGDINTTVK
jgi:hypothetical protein